MATILLDLTSWQFTEQLDFLQHQREVKVGLGNGGRFLFLGTSYHKHIHTLKHRRLLIGQDT